MIRNESKLEGSLNTLVSPRNAIDAFKRVRYRFPTNYYFFEYASQQLQQKGMHIPPEGVWESLTGRRKKIRKGLEEVTLELDKQLRGEKSVDVHSDHFLPLDRREAPKIFKEMRVMVQPLMDWYQFESKTELARFLAEELCGIQWEKSYSKSPRLLKKKLNLLMDLLGGYNYKVLTNEKIAVHRLMHDMLTTATTHYQKWSEGYQPYRPSMGILPQTQSLSSFVDESIKKLLRREDVAAVAYVNHGLGEFKRTGQFSNLVSKLKRSYHFPSKGSVKKFIFEFAGNAANPYQKGGIGAGIPTNTHRKLYSVALILDYASQSKLDVDINPSLFYVGRNIYLREVDKLKHVGLKGEALASVIGNVIGVSEGNARGEYASGRRKSVRLDYYSRLCEFNDATLPNISFVDITDPSRMQREKDRFMSSYKGGRILVIAGRIFAHRGNVSSEYAQVLKEIKDKIESMGGLPFLFPTFAGITPQVSGYLHYKELLTGTKYKTF